MKALMSPVILLDVDGVLNAHEWCHIPALPRINQRSATVLNEIIRRTSSELVIISTWRSVLLRGEVNAKGFEWMLATHGIHARVRGWTPANRSVEEPEPVQRSRFVSQWLADHKPEQWCVIDDLPLTVEKLIRPNPAIGLEPYHVLDACRFLGVR